MLHSKLIGDTEKNHDKLQSDARIIVYECFWR